MAPRAYGVDFLDNAGGQAPARSDESTIVQRVAAAQSAAGGSGSAGLASRIQARLGGGDPLPTPVQRRLEHGLGGSLGQVRVHTDGAADSLARSLQARAFTTGSDIFFRAGQYDPGSPKGLHVLAHEAGHTLQQSRGPVDGQRVGDVQISDPGDRFERAADDGARRVLAGEAAPAWGPAAQRSGAPVVQRMVEPYTHDSSATGAMLVVQRTSLKDKWADHLSGLDRSIEGLRWVNERVPPRARPEWDDQCTNLWWRGYRISEITSAMRLSAKKGQVEDAPEPEDTLATDMEDMFAKYRLEDVEQSTSEWSAPATVDVGAPPKQRDPEKDEKDIMREVRRLQKADKKADKKAAKKAAKLQHKLTKRARTR